MLNNKLRHTTLAAALPLLLLAACQSDELPTPPATTGTSTLTFTVDAGLAETRSVPEAGENTNNQETSAQHVQAVKLYIFKGSGSNATFVGIDTGTEETNWKSLPLQEGGDKVGEGEGTTSRTYTLQTKLDPQTEYTLLGVAYEAEDIYDITPTMTQEATVDLNALYSQLKADKDKDDIKQNEYFTGTVTQTTDANGQLPEGTTVTMRRRVAGLGANLKLKNFPEQPGAVAVMLWDDPYKDVPTIKKIWQAPNVTDHGTTTLTGNDTAEDSPRCLLWMKDNITVGTDEATTKTYYTASASAYALPKEAPAPDAETNYTLAVVVYNEEDKVICTKRAALREDGQLIFATDLGTGIVDDESFYRYPIVANRFYRFGTADNQLLVEFDPSNPFEIEVEKGWEGNPDLDFQ